MLPPDGPGAVDLAVAYGTGSESEQNFVQDIGLFLVTFLKEHGKALEVAEGQQHLFQGLKFLIMISKEKKSGDIDIDDTELFKITLDYWNYIASSLFNDTGVMGNGSPQGLMNPLMLGAQATPRRQLYSHALSQVRMVMIMRMAKPEEVLVVEVDGEVIREKISHEVDSIELYNLMRETLVYLTHLDHEDTEQLMMSKLQAQVDGSEYSWKALNTLCWAIGSISGAMSEDKEKRFLVIVIKELLGLCETRVGKDHKAIIASNIMYIVGQYPRFLRAHWKFLKTVVNKLFEFMHEKHEGVQDMACDTFIKISNECKSHFVQQQLHEPHPFIDEILAQMPTTICDLEHHQIHTFYEAVGHMIFAQQNTDTRANLIQRLMHPPNQQWQAILAQARQVETTLHNPQNIEMLINILKTNVYGCSTIGNDFIHQLQVIYMDMLVLYKKMSETIAGYIASTGEMATSQPIIKSMRIIKKEILKLIGTWVPMSENPEAVKANFTPPLLDAVLQDYQNSIPQARDAEVLMTMSKVVNRLKEHIQVDVLRIFGHTFEPTLDMIKNDFTTFPEHRTTFYTLLLSITTHCFGAFASLTEQQFEMVIQAIIWGFQHPIRNVAEISLKIMLELFTKVMDTPQEFAQQFFGKFYITVLEALFMVVVDSLHYSELDQHSMILSRMFLLVENNSVQIPLDPAQAAPSNQAFLTEHVCQKLHQQFPGMAPANVLQYVQGFFTHDQDAKQFKNWVRDFLIESKVNTKLSVCVRAMHLHVYHACCDAVVLCIWLAPY